MGLLSDRTVLRQQDGGASPRQVLIYTPVLHDMSKLLIPALLRLHINYFFTFKYKLALTMALYEGFGMSFVKMPKYLPTNKYQNKDDAFTYLKNIMKRSIIVGKSVFSVEGLCCFA